MENVLFGFRETRGSFRIDRATNGHCVCKLALNPLKAFTNLLALSIQAKYTLSGNNYMEAAHVYTNEVVWRDQVWLETRWDAIQIRMIDRPCQSAEGLARHGRATVRNSSTGTSEIEPLPCKAGGTRREGKRWDVSGCARWPRCEVTPVFKQSFTQDGDVKLHWRADRDAAQLLWAALRGGGVGPNGGRRLRAVGAGALLRMKRRSRRPAPPTPTPTPTPMLGSTPSSSLTHDSR